ncbi:hypothetical protein EDD86DRAFT_246902 [Gorgonomyces haynaldii]|nr:hypothetical protein EDD86DRAFT_246902 [Gorgonomyces haynaldii]
MNFTQMDKEGLPPFLSNDAVMFLQQSHSIFSLMTLEYEDRLWELLMEAVTDDNLEAVEYLVDRGAPWLVRDWEDPPLDIPGLKLTGLSFSCYHGSPRVATYFIFHFPQENLEPSQHIKIVEILLDYDIDFQSGLNPILLSLSNYKLLQLLIEYVKVDKSLVKRMLLTAFEHVIANGNEQLLQ